MSIGGRKGRKKREREPTEKEETTSHLAERKWSVKGQHIFLRAISGRG